MVDVKTLYDDVILDHIKNARNYRKIENANFEIQEFNPLCGDVINLYVTIDDKKIADIGFQCTCCGISMASASIMTEKIKGQTKADAQELSQQFVRLLEQHGEEMTLGQENNTLAVLATIRKFPSRVSCATLAWKALERILAK